MVSIFTYNFDSAKKAFEEKKVKLVTLTNYHVLLDQALRTDYITEADLKILKSWRADPANWGDTTVKA